VKPIRLISGSVDNDGSGADGDCCPRHVASIFATLLPFAAFTSLVPAVFPPFVAFATAVGSYRSGGIGSAYLPAVLPAFPEF
jgi:hypothetical protein